VQESGVIELSGGTSRGGEEAGSPSRPALGSPVVRLIVSTAAAEALADAVSDLSMEHMLRAIVKLQNDRVQRAFASLDIDEAKLAEALTPSPALVALRRSLQAATAAKHDAVAGEDYEAAESFRKTEELLGREVENAELDWKSPGPGPDEE
ncbi:MAG: hypothetical protein ACREQ5_31985, partial [Candidatus Dormibacteria bacterium]